MIEHLKRHRKAYERHEAGETYANIAMDLGVSASRARQLAKRWERELQRFTDMAQSLTKSHGPVPHKICVSVSLVCPHCSGILCTVLDQGKEYERFTHTCGQKVYLRLDSVFYTESARP